MCAPLGTPLLQLSRLLKLMVNGSPKSPYIAGSYKNALHHLNCDQVTLNFTMSIPEEAPRIPGWKPVIFLNIEVDEPKSIYVNNTGSHTGVNITGGFMKSIDPEYPFDAAIDSGYDDIRADPGSTTSRLDCRVYLTTSEGAGVFMTYPGVVRMEKVTVEVLTQKSSFSDFNDGYVTCTPVVKLDEKAKKEQWITKETLFGKGRFVRDNEGKLKVQYYLYILG